MRRTRSGKNRHLMQLWFGPNQHRRMRIEPGLGPDDETPEGNRRAIAFVEKILTEGHEDCLPPELRDRLLRMKATMRPD